MDHDSLVYKVDKLVQSSLMLTLIQGSFLWSALRLLNCNIGGILSSNYRSQILSSIVPIENPSWDSLFSFSLKS